MASKRWTLAERLEALRLPVRDTDILEEMTREQQRTTAQLVGQSLNADGQYLFALTQIHSIWPALSKKQRITLKTKKIAHDQWQTLDQETKDEFAAQTASLRRGNIDAIKTVLNKYAGGKFDIPRPRQPAIPSHAIQSVSNDQSMDLATRSRLALKVTTMCNAQSLSKKTRAKQEASIQTWCKTLRKQGKGLFGLKYAHLCPNPDCQRSKRVYNLWIDDAWTRMKPRHRVTWKEAAHEFWYKGLDTFVNVAIKYFGPLPELMVLSGRSRSNMSAINQASSSSQAPTSVPAPAVSSTLGNIDQPPGAQAGALGRNVAQKERKRKLMEMDQLDDAQTQASKFMKFLAHGDE